MATLRTIRRLCTTVVVCLVLGTLAFPPPAGAHFLDGSSVSLRVGETDLSATVNLSIGPLREALGPDDDGFDAYAAEVVAYLDEHITVVGNDGRVWEETYIEPSRAAVQGVQAFRVEILFDSHGADPSDFTITYEPLIEAIEGHETVMVLTNSEGRFFNLGILNSDRTSVDVGEGAGSVAFGDMVEFGFDHVLDGADHLLFLMTLLVPAPLVVAGRRWERGPSATATLRKVVHVITAFTLGHSVTLMLAALGWVSVPARPVETLIAASVGMAAIHAIRPLTNRGEVVIATGFGLIHGLAFAGILDDLGLSGTTSVLSLLAFNVGIELSQLITAALVFPSLWLLSTTRWYPVFRVAGGGLAFAAAVGWGLDRLEVLDNPLASIEDAAIDHPWRIVVGLLVVALLAAALDRTTAVIQPRQQGDHDESSGRDLPLAGSTRPG